MVAKDVLTVCVTGAAGQIGYAIVPMIANGDMFGKNQKVRLHLLDLEFCMTALGGVVMEVEDGNFPLVAGVVATDDPDVAYDGADCAVLLGAFPRKEGMERSELMQKNITIFKAMGESIERKASPDIKVLIVGNPANTNALICSKFAPKVPKKNFTAMTRLDHNRALGQIALDNGTPVNNVKNVVIWGNHSSTQYPDVSHAIVNGAKLDDASRNKYREGDFITTIQKRGAAIINARKASSALSAARAAVMHMNSWICGTNDGEYVSMGVQSEGNSYNVQGGIIYSFPCTCKDGEYTVVSGLNIDEFSRQKMKVTEDELVEEKKLAEEILK